MSQVTEALELAERIVAYHKNKDKPDLNCGWCRGKGTYIAQDHQGDDEDRERTCPCVSNKRRDYPCRGNDEDLLYLAKRYVLMSAKLEIKPRRLK